MRKKTLLLTLASLALLAAITPVLLHITLTPVRFNQYYIEGIEIRRGWHSLPYLKSTIRSAWSSGFNIITGNPHWQAPNLNKPEEVLQYIFSWLPGVAEVYPTEAFYYYSFFNGKQSIWGNLGTASLEHGRLDLAYFNIPKTQTYIHSFDAKDGIDIEPLGKHIYKVSYNNRSVVFKQNPRVTQAPESLSLAESEEFIGRVHDESGVRLFLFYDKELWSFYYVLDEEHGLDETLRTFGRDLEVGERTGFVYARDSKWKRRILTGVNQNNIEQNNFFDGPCDQVPFKANLRERLHHAYPNSMLHDGVDEHGVWQNKAQWQRLAICAFRQYRNINEIQQHVMSCKTHNSGPKWWDCLSREWWNTPFWRTMMLKRLLAEGKQPPLKPGEETLIAELNI